MPTPLTSDEAKFEVIHTLTIAGLDNSTLIGPNFVSDPIHGQPSNTTEGRTLAVKMTGGNITFSTPATVINSGTNACGR